jgi:hypothetical protein
MEREAQPFQRPPARQEAPAASREDEEITRETALVDPADVQRRMRERQKLDPNFMSGVVSKGRGAGAKVPEDIYEAELVFLDMIQLPDLNDSTKMKDMVEWHFKIINDRDYTDTVIRGLSTDNYAEQSKLVAWCSALMGRTIGIGERADLPSVLGKQCRIKVAFNDKGYSTIKDVMKQSNRNALPA